MKRISKSISFRRKLRQYGRVRARNIPRGIRPNGCSYSQYLIFTPRIVYSGICMEGREPYDKFWVIMCNDQYNIADALLITNRPGYALAHAHHFLTGGIIEAKQYIYAALSKSRTNDMIWSINPIYL